MLSRFIVISQILVAGATLALGCASGPAVISSTADSIVVEFPTNGTVKDASELAKKECETYGKVADFDSVDTSASPKTRVARFNCVSQPGSSTVAE